MPVSPYGAVPKQAWGSRQGGGPIAETPTGAHTLSWRPAMGNSATRVASEIEHLALHANRAGPATEARLSPVP